MTELSTALAELNRRRLRVLGPLMLVVHVAHVAFFHVPASERASLPATTVHWRDLLVAAHGLTLPLILVLTTLAFRVRDPRWSRLLAPATVLVYVIHGAVVSSIDQLVSTNISAYIGYCIGLAVIVSLPLVVSVPVYALGLATMVTGLMTMQPATAARTSSFPTSTTVALVSMAISGMLDRNRRRELGQRAIIDRQRDELAALNLSLEQRVRDQVREIVARADEVEQLNAQLQAQVRARSTELSLALARLAGRRAHEEMLPSGMVLADRFTVGEALGKGGMGTVYAGVDRSTGQRVAIKVIQAWSSGQLDAMRRFIREAGTAATVRHPAVVRMLHVDVSDDGQLFQVQELVDGATLAGYLQVTAWPGPAAARLGAVLCDALAAAHALGVVHRDVKPDNIMLTTTAPGLKLLDFGIAKLYDAVLGGDGTTEARMIIGTPGYMAPEQAQGAGGVSDRADVYAVGVMLARMVGGPREVADVEAQLAGAPPPLATLVRRCIADTPTARPSAAEAAAELARIADAAGVPSLELLVPGLPAVAPEAAVSQAAIATTPQRRV